MQPDLELVRIGETESFKAWEHGYPFHTVRWHFHPEYELHLVCATSGRYFIGDFIGQFAPGNLVLVGPNLPHNWVSEVDDEAIVPLRSRVMQFTEDFVTRTVACFPELVDARKLFERSKAGVLFSSGTSARVAELMRRIVPANGTERIALFLGIVAALEQDRDAQTLTSQQYLPDPSGFMSTGINEVLAHINDNLTETLDEETLAQLAGVTPSTLSRSFRRHTGQSLTKYVNRLRVTLACQLLMSSDFATITDVCYASGFNNVSNFNRQFLALRGVTPTQFRRLLLENKNIEEAA
ncbi:AraC-like ligand binding domain-containing protein [Devosia lucknowensis]|uniref:AraC-like ligand binding domain-containing protein n=1 Tax=Devosia lucknowensis TaxID=1096929 RepID=A0A1Y6ETY6_9HYPH|nr:AraC family transcriptional regulator [Devosia lucknowensis]SMQ64691.1 AraC-like ligand binding domain-containing protein [Devosia lucknowensis]